MIQKHYDVVVAGAGLAGLTLCRQLRLAGKERILLLDNRADLPGKTQKVGESLLQVAGYYLGKVLDLEEYLLREHYLKYNLRFHWKTAGKANENYEDYSQAYILPVSNIASYQLDRNKLEAHLLELLRADPHATVCAPARNLRIQLSESGNHLVSFVWNDEVHDIEATWVVDTTGRGQFLKRKQSLGLPSPIRHGSSWCWVDGLVNIDKLTDLSPQQVRLRPERQTIGMFPIWLGTNHFCGEGFWFWVIPLQGLTSLGLVYDRELFDGERVSTPEKLIEWACHEFPLFRRDLPQRKILDGARLPEYAYDCQQTLSPQRWALSGMAGRFSDPLYSPGSDLIAYYNTLIVDAILEKNPEEFRRKCTLYEQLMRSLYGAYVPSYAVSYNALGDQEVMTLKYGWELAIYFVFYVLPFINDLFTNTEFLGVFFRKFAMLGPVNHNLQKFLADYFRWKKDQPPSRTRIFNDFEELRPLAHAKTVFFDVGISLERAELLLADHSERLREFARYILAYVSSVVLRDERVLYNASFISSIRLRDFTFDPPAIEQRYAPHRNSSAQHTWSFDSRVLEKFRQAHALELQATSD
ncbi:MAG: NAD(P)/FAD-dependent oxidoreductase [Acidobacteriota bacterium]